ncbi:hypothetical protein [Winogradskyella sp.]|uniref:hypothetical protein n=1 Tax=Winogradskyella sp. TaxID=1883156 RepID=UPI00263352DD|nr:hypothetical protein [Winogradskyella sp.]
MNNTKIAHATTNISFYDVIDKQASIKNAKLKLTDYKIKWLKKHKSGGVTSTTFDVFFALLSCVAPTMEDMKKNQPKVYEKAWKEGKFFAFVYNDTLATKINNLKEDCFKVCRLSTKTIYNHIKRLIEAGVITEKLNYNKRGQKGYDNPLPGDLNPKGRGKIQLFFDPKVLKLKPQFAAASAPNTKSLPQYTTSCFQKNKELETIIDNDQAVDKVAFANAHNVSDHVINEEQGRKKPVISYSANRQFDRKKDYLAYQLFELCRSGIYAGKKFNATLENNALGCIDEHLENIKQLVQAFKADKIKSFQLRVAYKNATELGKERMLRSYLAKLPENTTCAVEILGHAIVKQANHAKKHGYIHRLGYPVDFLNSNNFHQAIEYSFNDWKKINNRFFVKNQRYSAYCDIVKKIYGAYSSCMNQSFESVSLAYRNSLVHFQKLQRALSCTTDLTSSNKKSLRDLFLQKFNALFKHLSKEDKQRIIKTL